MIEELQKLGFGGSSDFDILFQLQTTGHCVVHCVDRPSETSQSTIIQGHTMGPGGMAVCDVLL